jgi:hypothetical protein
VVSDLGEIVDVPTSKEDSAMLIMSASGRHPATIRPTSGTSSRNSFAPNTWLSRKRCSRLATARCKTPELRSAVQHEVGHA